MPLGKQITQISIGQGPSSSQSFSYQLKPQNVDVELQPVFYSSAYDEAVDGSLRQNLRGWRLLISINYDAFISGTVSGTNDTFEELMDDLYAAFVTDVDPVVQVTLTTDGNSASYSMILEDISILTSYRSQISQASGSINFIGQEMLTSIPATLQSS